MGIPDHLTCLLKKLYKCQEATESDMKQLTGTKLGKEYDKTVSCHHAYLIYMKSTSYEILDWMNHKLESRLPGEISTASFMQIIPLSRQKEELKCLLMVKAESEKAGLNLNMKNLRSWHLVACTTTWKIEGGKVGAVTGFILFVSKITADDD